MNLAGNWQGGNKMLQIGNNSWPSKPQHHEHSQHAHHIDTQGESKRKAKHHQVDVQRTDIEIGRIDEDIADNLSFGEYSTNRFAQDGPHDDSQQENERNQS